MCNICILYGVELHCRWFYPVIAHRWPSSGPGHSVHWNHRAVCAALQLVLESNYDLGGYSEQYRPRYCAVVDTAMAYEKNSKF